MADYRELFERTYMPQDYSSAYFPDYLAESEVQRQPIPQTRRPVNTVALQQALSSDLAAFGSLDQGAMPVPILVDDDEHAEDPIHGETSTGTERALLNSVRTETEAIAQESQTLAKLASIEEMGIIADARNPGMYRTTQAGTGVFQVEGEDPVFLDSRPQLAAVAELQARAAVTQDQGVIAAAQRGIDVIPGSENYGRVVSSSGFEEPVGNIYTANVANTPVDFTRASGADREIGIVAGLAQPTVPEAQAMLAKAEASMLPERIDIMRQEQENNRLALQNRAAGDNAPKIELMKRDDGAIVAIDKVTGQSKVVVPSTGAKGGSLNGASGQGGRPVKVPFGGKDGSEIEVPEVIIESAFAMDPEMSLEDYPDSIARAQKAKQILAGITVDQSGNFEITEKLKNQISDTLAPDGKLWGSSVYPLAVSLAYKETEKEDRRKLKLILQKTKAWPKLQGGLLRIDEYLAGATSPTAAAPGDPMFDQKINRVK